VSAASRLLGREGGWAVVGAGERLPGSRRSVVVRLGVSGAAAPGSVIVKAFVSLPGMEARERFLNEAAAAVFLGDDGELAGFGPRLIAADPEVPLVVLEDLGIGVGLADALLGSDRAAAEGALLAYARSLGALHARTLGRREEFERHRKRFGEAAAVEPAAVELRAGVDRWRSFLADLDLTLSRAVERELEAVAELGRGEELDAFTPSDTCPDNNVLAGGGLRFFDFEAVGFRHAMLDAAYIGLAFPTCWCVNRLPTEVVQGMLGAYRAELAPAAPDVNDDGFFADRLLRACAWWLVITTGWLLPHLREHDAPVGPPGRHPATRRQCVFHRLELFAGMSQELGELQGLGRLAEEMTEALRRWWPREDCELPLYPPFR
jgi:hypothetical protein